MCGIFGYIGGNSTAAHDILEGLKSLEYRGYDSWGVAVLPDSDHHSRITLKKDVGKIGQATVDDMPASSMGFGHTRWATHGGVTVANAHPHLDCHQETAVIHNGIIENYLDLKKSLTHKHKFKSETDTEVAVHLIEETLQKKVDLPAAVRQVFKKFEGNNAIIVFDAHHRQIVAAKNGSPLVIGFGKDGHYLASDPAALLPHTKKVYYLEDGQMAVLDDQGVEIFEIKSGKKVQYQMITLKWDVSQADKGNYQFFMEKEMREEPSIINDIALRAESETAKVVSLLRKYDDVLFIGCGTASYACWAAAHLFSEIAHKRVSWAAASEFNHLIEFVNKKTLLIAVSQSGETMDLITVVKQAQAQGAKVVAMVNVLGSTLYRMSDVQVLIGAGPEKAVVCTKAFSGMLAHIIRLAFAYDNRFAEGQKLLLSAARAVSQVLSTQNWHRLKNLAEKLVKAEHIFVIGRGSSSVIAIETALKIKEITYIHAEGIVGGELKHGPLALIDQGTPCIVLAPADDAYEATISSATEISARGGTIFGIASKKSNIFDEYFEIEYQRQASVLVTAIAGQILAYHMTQKLGLDPDMPRNLAKSVTVG